MYVSCNPCTVDLSCGFHLLRSGGNKRSYLVVESLEAVFQCNSGANLLS